MKFPNKIWRAAVAVVGLAALAAAVWLLMAAPGGRVRRDLRRVTAAGRVESSAGPRNDGPAYRVYTLAGALDADSEASPGTGSAVSAPPDLASRLRLTAERMVFAVLPEHSAVMAPSPEERAPRLLDAHEAEIRGRAVIPATSVRPEQTVAFRVRVRFLDSGDCEARFPEFTVAR